MIGNSYYAAYQARQTRLALLAASTYSTVILSAGFLFVISGNGISTLDAVSTSLFVILSFWISIGFWNAVLGFRCAVTESRTARHKLKPSSAAAIAEKSRTAILMPVYNEDPEAVFSRIHAMIQSLHETGGEDGFEFFVLSDTTNPDIALREELIWTQYVEHYHPPINVYYRRRAKNLRRKAGNIADFCERWGRNYDFMLILDADSVMSGRTILELVRRMLLDPRLGILQAPPRPVNRQSLFARLQQFAAAVYGPLCVRGFCSWTATDGNYWGHNAILRVRPFVDHCELPVLSGSRPLGGDILSHDFVEAALMLRAGFKVQIADDLEGSYEECPTTLADYAQRDQRWCQGNMQHARLVMCEGFRPLSRIHFAMGVMSYVASPIWLAFIGSLLATRWIEGPAMDGGAIDGYLMLTVFSISMVMLLVPKFLSLYLMSRNREQSRRHGGRLALFGSTILETAISIIFAPVMAYYHSRFVLSTLMGKTVAWNCQQRDETNVSLKDAWSMHWDVMLFYAILGGLVAWSAPALLPWFVPMLIGPMLIVPLASAFGSRGIGHWLQKRNLLLIPEEETRPQVLRTLDEAAAFFRENPLVEPGRDILQTVLANRGHSLMHMKIARDMLPAHEPAEPFVTKNFEEVESYVRSGEFSRLPIDVRRSLILDNEAFKRLAMICQNV
ncbi:glucans biosynthesis glucosyltransferase MdoH [Rubinisphaera margarita]|uniref:glucans biosynthesis glucosyltransferase MdoH n=1 Tax=Rubinisphaera margarita TaxID=2909586 RepID=UPI001EE7E071|nr:glucans biosynthesis glucosyltransferase MdoH [Rubinisphaera margarita]MCG6156895.1 glucans biosynthesis glucosyltransferase MdoH [Rubinisphaera margarita]